MKKEMVMKENGNHEEILSPILHKCISSEREIQCVEYGWDAGNLILRVGFDEEETFFTYETQVNFCPFCGYKTNR